MGLLDLFNTKKNSTDAAKKPTKYIPYKAEGAYKLDYEYYFYRNCFRAMATFCICIGFINLGLAAYTINLYYSKIEQTYYATTYEGELVPLTPKEQA